MHTTRHAKLTLTDHTLSAMCTLSAVVPKKRVQSAAKKKQKKIEGKIDDAHKTQHVLPTKRVQSAGEKNRKKQKKKQTTKQTTLKTQHVWLAGIAQHTLYNTLRCQCITRCTQSGGIAAFRERQRNFPKKYVLLKTCGRRCIILYSSVRTGGGDFIYKY